MKTIKTIVLFLAVAFFTACGGGGSGTGGGGGTIPAGTYTGTISYTISGAGLPTFSDTITFTVVVNADGTFSYTDSDGGVASGTISGNAIILSEDLSISEPGLTCSGRAVYSIFISGTSVTGTIGGDSVVCNGISISITGTITGSRTSASVAGSRAGAVAGLSAIRRSLGALGR